MAFRRSVPVALACALFLSACAPSWEWISGAESNGPRWLAILIGAVELLIVAIGITAAVWPQRSDPPMTETSQMGPSAESADGLTRR